MTRFLFNGNCSPTSAFFQVFLGKNMLVYCTPNVLWMLLENNSKELGYVIALGLPEMLLYLCFMPRNLFPLKRDSLWEVCIILSAWTSADFLFLQLLVQIHLASWQTFKSHTADNVPTEWEASDKNSSEGSPICSCGCKNETMQGKDLTLFCSQNQTKQQQQTHHNTTKTKPIYFLWHKASMFRKS